MTQNSVIERQITKTPEQQFLWVMQAEYDYSPKLSAAILAEAETCLLGSGEGLRPGQQKVILTQRRERHGQALEQVKKIEVVWTVDGGLEDCREEEQSGKVGVRQMRIRRMVAEAREQGGIATQEDLARVLHVSVRTIKRDFAEMKARGLRIPSRGYDEGIGRGQTHKGEILRGWLGGQTYDQLKRETGHSLASIQRYIHAFVRVVELHQQGFEAAEIALLAQIGRGLAEEYLRIYAQNQSPAQAERLEIQRKRLLQGGSSRGASLKKGGL